MKIKLKYTVVIRRDLKTLRDLTNLDIDVMNLGVAATAILFFNSQMAFIHKPNVSSLVTLVREKNCLFELMP